jgi:peptide/nickel transport system substrate-binding protein
LTTKKLRFTLIAAVALLVALLLSACGGGGSSSSESESSSGPETAPTTSSTTETEPASAGGEEEGSGGGGTINIGLGALTPTLNPWENSPTPPRSYFVYSLYSFLTKVSGEEGEAAKTSPDVAASWKQVKPTKWEFKLKPGLKFPDGEAIDAKAIAWDIEYVLDPKNEEELASLLGGVTKVAAVSPTVLDVETEAAVSTLPRLLGAMALVPPKAFEKAGAEKFWANPEATGPFKVASFEPEQKVVLVPNPDSIEGRPKSEKLVFTLVPEEASRISALQSGGEDIIDSVPTDQVEGLEGSGNEIVAPAQPGTYILDLYSKSGPLADAKVRQAINYAVDKEALIENLLGGYGEVSEGQLPTKTVTGFCPQVSAYEYDPEKAKELLAEAGVKEGTTLTFQTSNGFLVDDTLIAQAIAQMLEEVGLKINLQVLETARYFEAYAEPAKRKELFSWRLEASPQMDASIQYAFYLKSNTVHNIGFENAEFEKAYAAAQKAPDESAERQTQMCKMAEVMKEEAPVMFGFAPPDIWAVNGNVSGFSLNITDNPNLADLEG